MILATCPAVMPKAALTSANGVVTATPFTLGAINTPPTVDLTATPPIVTELFV